MWKSRVEAVEMSLGDNGRADDISLVGRISQFRWEGVHLAIETLFPLQQNEIHDLISLGLEGQNYYQTYDKAFLR